MKKFKQAHHLIGADNQPVRVPIKVENITVTEWSDITGDIFLIILNNSPIKTQNDCIQGARLYQAIESGKGKEFIELEEGVHDWFKPIAEQFTPVVFRINGNIVYKFICEGFEKPKESKK